MRTREAFRGAQELLAGYAPRSTDLPAFTYLPGPNPPAAAARSANVALAPATPACGGESIAGALAGMADGRLTAVDLVEQAYTAIAARDAALSAFTYVRPRAESLAEAVLLDRDRRGGAPRGPLHGVPISVKDVIHVAGMPTTASSRVLEAAPEPADAQAVARLRDAGAIVIGKTSTHEFALGVTSPQCRNPWDPERLAGGSTGGSAIALAAGMGLGALGTDTRASIRVPAALCGVVGFKPTYNLISTDGVVTLSWSMDHTAPMAKTVADAALLLDVLAPRTGAHNGWAAPAYGDAVGKPVAGLRLGVPRQGLVGADPPVTAAFTEAIACLRGLGVAIVELDEPDARDFALANAAGLIVSRAEAAAYHAPWLDRLDLYSADVSEQLDEALGVRAVDYVQAQRYRADLQRRMLRLFEPAEPAGGSHRGGLDALALPTSKAPAPLIEESEAMLLVLSENCVPWSFIGFPAVSLPCGAAPGNLPIGLQLVAAPYAERTLIALGSAYESEARVSHV